ncbi:MAG: Mitochondrial porin [Bathelium mastoideum]|nr:MAG: Mitochondrial porin [Bathelium mastoideum]
MASPDFSDVAKPSDGRASTGPPTSYQLPIPAFSDIAKSANDLLNKDFYHVAAADLQVKLKTPNDVAVTIKGKNSHDAATSGSIEGKFTSKPQGIHLLYYTISIPVYRTPTSILRSFILFLPTKPGEMSTRLTVTQGWTTQKLLDTKVEFDNTIAKGLKLEVQNLFSPEAGDKGQKVNFHFKQPAFNTRAFFDRGANGNLSAIIDAVGGYEGFLVGGEAGYDVNKAAITRYSAAIGYQTPSYTAALTSTSNMQVFAGSYYHKVNSNVEAGAKTTFDTKAGNTMGLELATKYKIDPASFAKAKLNDQGIASVSYSTKVNSGFTFGVGLSLDSKKLNEAGHKVGTSFQFDG